MLDQKDLFRIKFIQELQEQIVVNDEAVAVILNLADQINYLLLKMDKAEQ